MLLHLDMSQTTSYRLTTRPYISVDKCLVAQDYYAFLKVLIGLVVLKIDVIDEIIIFLKNHSKLLIKNLIK